MLLMGKTPRISQQPPPLASTMTARRMPPGATPHSFRRFGILTLPGLGAGIHAAALTVCPGFDIREPSTIN